jgi:hypothetical protein
MKKINQIPINERLEKQLDNRVKILYFHKQGKSFEEIAEKTGLSPSTIQNFIGGKGGQQFALNVLMSGRCESWKEFVKVCGVGKPSAKRGEHNIDGLTRLLTDIKK